MKTKVLKCFDCGKKLTKMTAAQIHDHMIIHKRDAIIADYPILVEIDSEIAKKFDAEIKILFK